MLQNSKKIPGNQGNDDLFKEKKIMKINYCIKWLEGI